MTALMILLDLFLVLINSTWAIEYGYERSYGWAALFAMLACAFWRALWFDIDSYRKENR